MQNNYNNKEEYAGFWVRFFAYMIDCFLVFFALLIVRLIMSGVMSAVKGTVLGGNILFQYSLKDIVLYVLQVLYFILCTYYTGTTLGKKALNLRVVCADEREKLTMLNVIYRETIGRFLCGAILGAGYIMAGIDGEKRGLHDILCDTRVIYAKKMKIIEAERGIRTSYVEGGYAAVNPAEAAFADMNFSKTERTAEVKLQNNEIPSRYEYMQPEPGKPNIAEKDFEYPVSEKTDAVKNDTENSVPEETGMPWDTPYRKE